AGVVGAAGAAGGVLLLGTSGCLVALVQAVGRHAHQSPYVHTTPQPCVRQLWRRISAARCSSWRRVVPCHWTGAAPAVSSSQRGQPWIRRPKFVPWVCFVAICSPDSVQGRSATRWPASHAAPAATAAAASSRRARGWRTPTLAAARAARYC